jgi:hypothetical protein
MLPFILFLKEEAEEGEKLKHITHAEDRPLQNGAAGFKLAHDSLMAAHHHMKSGGHSSALTMKYDGSPSLVFVIIQRLVNSLWHLSRHSIRILKSIIHIKTLRRTTVTHLD